MIISLLMLTVKLLTRARFELTVQERPQYRSAAQPVELSSHWERCVHLIYPAATI